MLNLAASAPDEIVTVADSETWIVAAVAEVAMFSAAEKVEDELNVGALKSGAYRMTINPEPPAPELLKLAGLTFDIPAPPPAPELAAPFAGRVLEGEL
jgi:hypothetical protein